jgi:hypothetical protein
LLQGIRISVGELQKLAQSAIAQGVAKSGEAASEKREGRLGQEPPLVLMVQT